MKVRLIGIFLIVLISFSACSEKKSEEHNSTTSEASQTSEAKLTKIEFPEPKFDFGIVPEGETREHDYLFKNTGENDLIVSKVKPTCSCTSITDWTKDPVPPGKEGFIRVKFNSVGKKGKNTKSVNVISNTDPKVSKIMFFAEVP